MKTLMAGLVALSLGLGGCLVVHGKHGGKAVITPLGVIVKPAHDHHHDDHCGHYHHEGRWYYMRGHHHHHGCGHVFVRGTWVLRVN